MKIVLGRPQGSPLQPDICVVSTAESRHHNNMSGLRQSRLHSFTCHLLLVTC
ncbi:hypothetical protein ISS30_07125, partial [bacterium]|nr:hypothetical protein [bacterium]